MNSSNIKITTTESPTNDEHDMLSASNARFREVISSRALFAGRSQVVIEHLGEHYVLRMTKQGKLILNK